MASAETETPETPVFEESLGSALIDAARITVMAALAAFPRVIQVPLPEEAETPTVQECLVQAAQWLDAARAIALDQSPAATTSLHVVRP